MYISCKNIGYKILFVINLNYGDYLTVSGVEGKKKSKKSRRKFLITLAGLGALGYILYIYRGSYMNFIGNITQTAQTPSATTKPPESTAGGEKPVFTGVEAPPKPEVTIQPYNIITNPNVMTQYVLIPPSTYVLTLVFEIANIGYGPSIEGVAEVYAVERGRSDVDYSSESYLRGGWLDIATKIAEVNYLLMPRMRKRIKVEIPGSYSPNYYTYYLVVGDKALDPPRYDLIDASRKAMEATI